MRAVSLNLYLWPIDKAGYSKIKIAWLETFHLGDLKSKKKNFKGLPVFCWKTVISFVVFSAGMPFKVKLLTSTCKSKKKRSRETNKYNKTFFKLQIYIYF